MEQIKVQLLSAPRPVAPPVNKNSQPFYLRANNANYFTYLLSLYKGSPKHGGIIKGKVKYIVGKGNKNNFNVNPNQKINELLRIICSDFELSNAFYLQVIRNQKNKILHLHRLSFDRIVRSSDGTRFWHLDDASKTSNGKPLRLFGEPITKENKDWPELFFYHHTDAGYNIYPDPPYISALDYIASDVEVGKHTYTNAKAGFKPGKVLTFVNGEPTEDVKRQVKKKVVDTYTGESGETIMIDFVSSIDRKVVIDDLGSSSLTTEDYSGVNQIIQDNIFTAHEITSPALFGIATEGKLGSSNELREAYEIFNNTYADARRQIIQEQLNTLLTEKIQIESLEPIGQQVPEQLIIQYAPRSWVLDKLGISQEAPIVEDPQDALFNEFCNHGTPKNTFEPFLVNLNLSVTAIDITDILSVIKSDPSADAETIANVLELEPSYVSEAIDKLSDKITKNKNGGFDVTGNVETYKVMFSYEWKPEIPSSQRDTSAHPSRDLCKKLMQLDRYYSRKDIEKISAKVGYSVFDRAGGWWTKPNGDASPSCRHKWFANLVVEKK